MNGRKLWLKRREARLTQKELGKLVGVSKQTVSRWELNQSKPNRQMARRLKKLLAKPWTIREGNLDKD